MGERKFPQSRKFAMLIGDICIIIGSYCIATAIILNKNILTANFTVYSDMLLAMIVVNGWLFNVNGLYSIGRKRFAEIILSLIVSMLGTAVIMMALSFFVREFSYSRGQLLTSLAIQLVAFIVWRRAMWHVERAIHAQRNAFLIGSKEECIHIYNRLICQPQLNWHLKYICTDMQHKDWQTYAAETQGLIICPSISKAEKKAVIDYCYRHHKQAILVPDMYEVLCSDAELGKIDDIPVFEIQNLQLSLEKRVLKRTLDLVVSGIAFLIALPFMAACAVAIKLGDHGPIFYSQVRTGKDGKPFKVHKFRTMRTDAEKYSGPQLAEENDPRITKVGNILRATRLDELPQIWNVVVGDMSLVGPRPERPYFVEQFIKDIPEYAYRTNIKPGITGLAQVYGKYNTTAYDKLIYDLMYIQRCSVVEDLIIMIQTVRVIFTKSATEGTGIQQETDLSNYEI